VLSILERVKIKNPATWFKLAARSASFDHDPGWSVTPTRVKLAKRQTRRAVFRQKLTRTQNFRFPLYHQNIREGGA
jgi:hypothetical protein